jgi:hypothetical protein
VGSEMCIRDRAVHRLTRDWRRYRRRLGFQTLDPFGQVFKRSRGEVLVHG